MADGQETIGYVDDLIQNGVEFMDSLIEALTNVMADIVSLLDVANGICPDVRAPICTVLTDSRTCNSEGIFDNSIFEKVVDYVNRGTIVSKVTDARQDLADMLTVTQNMEENVETFDWALYIAMVFAILLSLLALGMIVGLVIRKTNRMICLQSRFFFPLFVSLVVLSFVFSIAFVIASLGLSDTCVDDPDARLLSVADHFLSGGSPIIFEFVQLYLSRKLTVLASVLVSSTYLPYPSLCSYVHVFSPV
jgi:F0F1-type ATP synthase membrane subunit c/vacuolar-type H+-ATPase subunit K